jgi:hypothetical protein
MTRAEIQRRHRQRQADDIWALRNVEIHHPSLTYALWKDGKLDERLIDNRAAVTRAVERLLAEYALLVTSQPD